MNKDQTSPKRSARAWILYGLIAIVVLVFLSLFIQSCASEKVEICDVATGDCGYESSCQPLLFDLLSFRD